MLQFFDALSGQAPCTTEQSQTGRQREPELGQIVGQIKQGFQIAFDLHGTRQVGLCQTQQIRVQNQLAQRPGIAKHNCTRCVPASGGEPSVPETNGDRSRVTGKHS